MSCTVQKYSSLIRYAQWSPTMPTFLKIQYGDFCLRMCGCGWFVLVFFLFFPVFPGFLDYFTTYKWVICLSLSHWPSVCLLSKNETGYLTCATLLMRTAHAKAKLYQYIAEIRSSAIKKFKVFCNTTLHQQHMLSLFQITNNGLPFAPKHSSILSQPHRPPHPHR